MCRIVFRVPAGVRCKGRSLTVAVLKAGLAGLAVLASAGCARQITITQDPYINNAMQIDRRAEDRTGEPLELNIVCVYPTDLFDERNAALKPNAGITSEEWFKYRPLPGDQPEVAVPVGRFGLLEEQVFVLTNEPHYYGKKIGAALRGAKQDGATITKRGIAFNGWALHSEKAVIYVFGKFTDKQGKVLRIPPAMFHPPGAYGDKLAIKIGVREGGPDYGQYIEIDSERCPRKMHGGK